MRSWIAWKAHSRSTSCRKSDKRYGDQVRAKSFLLSIVVALSGLARSVPAQAPTSSTSLFVAPSWATAAAPLVLRGVTVIDVNDGTRRPGQTVAIVKNRIQAIGPDGAVKVPAGARVVEARGKYLIPGLW